MPDTLLDPKDLKAEIGGKPVWFWGLIGGVFVLALYYVFKSKKAANTAATMATGQGTISDTLNNAFPTIDTSAPAGVSTMTSNALGDQTLETKESWTNRAVIIGGRDGHSPIFMTNALNKYFAGTPLTQAEAGAVNRVISQIGLPPGGQGLIVKIVKPVTTKTKTNTSVNDSEPSKTKTPTTSKVTPKTPAAPAAPVKPKKDTSPVVPKVTAPGGAIDPRDAGRFPGWWASTHPTTKGIQV